MKKEDPLKKDYLGKQRKYNRPQLKKDYMASELVDVKYFFKDTYKATLSSYHQQKTKGRRKEKEGIIARAGQKGLENAEKALEKKYTIEKKDLIKMKYSAMSLFAKTLKELDQKARTKELLKFSRELGMTLDVIKRELGEPLTISQNHITDEEPEEVELEEKDQVALNEYFKSLGIDEDEDKKRSD